MTPFICFLILVKLANASLFARYKMSPKSIVF